MRNRKIAVFIALAAAALMACAPALAAGSAQRVFDNAGLLSVEERGAISEAISVFQAETGMDFVVLTSDDEHGDVGQQEISEQFYLRGGFGYGEGKDGVIYYIDMYERTHYITAVGGMIDYMTDRRKADAIDACAPYLTRQDYAGGINRMMQLALGYYKAGIPEGQYRYDVVTGQMLTARHKALTAGEIGVSALIAAVIGFIFTAIVRSRYKLKGSTYDYDYRTNSELKLTASADDYLRTTTTRTRKADPNTGGKGGGGGFGGGNGSGVHSSGGTSFSGSGGKF